MNEPLEHPLPEVTPQRSGERMWPLDLALVCLGALVLYTAATGLRWDDSRWTHHPLLYLIAVPVATVAASLLLRLVASRFVRRSVQLGMLVSVFVHLLLLIVASTWVIFSQLWPETFTGSSPQPMPVRKTVPDYLFTPRPSDEEAPDWSRPVDAETASTVVPEESRKLPPLEVAAERMELPTEPPREDPRLREVVIPRREADASLPSPESEPSKLARREVRPEPMERSAVEPPEVAPQEDVAARPLQRSDLQVNRSAAAGARPSAPAAADAAVAAPAAASAALPRRTSDDLPAPSGAALERIAATERPRPAGAASAAPAVPTVPLAQRDAEASLQMAERSLPQGSRRSTSGASLSASAEAAAAAQGDESAIDPGRPLPRRSSVDSGIPSVTAGSTAAAPPQRRGTGPATRPAPSGPVAVPRASIAEADRGEASGATNPLDQPASDRGEVAQRSDRAGAAAPAMAPMPLAIQAPEIGAGLAERLQPDTGIASTADQPDVRVADIGRPLSERRQLGGPMPPAGNQVAAVEAFRRRILRTQGAQAPAPRGMIGPESEEAIELGLRYLASRQNDNGGWSLQGPGESVMLRSDTAATGLCLLSFQGAGYTHREHRYADVVARGLQFLLTHQRDNGDLFRPEDAQSNQNVWLYSHSIAALALCEAYGMTGDPQLAGPAQRSLDFIVASQHPDRGGWRYQPQSSSDTSVTGWMMMALRSGELAGLEVPPRTYAGIDRWLNLSQEGPGRAARYRYNPFAPDTDAQRHGRDPTVTMTAVGLLMRQYLGWHRDHVNMQRGADYLADYLPEIGSPQAPQRDTYYWYYATQVMFHMGGEHWERWNRRLSPLLVQSQERQGELAGSWDPRHPVPDRWGPHGGRLYVTTLNLLSLEVYYRHLPIYEQTAR